jgi:fructose-specific phosphotransferase system IIA component
MALVDLIEEKVVKVPLKSTDKFGIIEELVDLLDAAGRIEDRTKAMDALIARENQGSTGLEQGIAVPHAKTDSVSSIAVAVGVSPGGVDFEAMDGKPSHLFFLMLAPPDQPAQHVEILSEIARLTKSPAVMKLLLSASSPKDVVEVFTED